MSDVLKKVKIKIKSGKVDIDLKNFRGKNCEVLLEKIDQDSLIIDRKEKKPENYELVTEESIEY